MRSAEDLTVALRRLLLGAADQAIRAGEAFVYDGGRLHADELADLMLPSVLCHAQELSIRVGLGSLGYRFSLGRATSQSLPLQFERDTGVAPKRFCEAGPVVLEVFEGEVMDCRADLVRLFESAARLVQPDFRLARDSNYAELAVTEVTT